VIVGPPFEELVLAEGSWFAVDRLSDPAAGGCSAGRTP
jgi:hypothetical protein